MEYYINVNMAAQGEVIQLINVAEAMAKHASTGYGKSTLHLPTLEEIRPKRISLLMDAAKQGLLKVCDRDGKNTDVETLIKSSLLPDSYEIEGVVSSDILALWVKAQQLIDWGSTNGDIFNVVDAAGQKVEHDLLNQNLGVIEESYYRGYVGGGEPVFFRLKSRASSCAAISEQQLSSEKTADEPDMSKMEQRVPETITKFGMRREAMVTKYKEVWPTIDRDIKDASENGLSFAKTGARDWDEDKALNWAQAKGKLFKASESKDTLTSGIHRMVSIKGEAHTL